MKLMVPFVRIIENTFYSDTNVMRYSQYLDFVILNSSEYMIIENDGDFQFGEYFFDNVLESKVDVLLFNNTIYNKPGSNIEPYREMSYTFDFSQASPFQTTETGPDPYYTDSYTVTEYNFGLPSFKIPKDYRGKKVKINIFSSSSDFCGYSEISFDALDFNSATLKLNSGDVPISIYYEPQSQSSAKLILNGNAPFNQTACLDESEGKNIIYFNVDDVEFTAYLDFYAKDEDYGSSLASMLQR